MDESAGVLSVALGRGAGGGVYECDAYAVGGALQPASGVKEIFEAAELGSCLCAEDRSAGNGGWAAAGPLAELPAFRDTVLIAPACHDTASAIAGIPAVGDDWAYISSGTWSLVGTLVEQPRNGAAERQENFTNLGAVGDRICFHKNVNGMWLIKQCMDAWAAAGRVWDVAELVAAAELAKCPEGLLDVDDPELMLAGRMPERINAQRRAEGWRCWMKVRMVLRCLRV